MKILEKIAIAFIPVLLAGCSSDDSVVEQEPNNNTPSKQQVTFTASLEDAITTRTSTSYNSTDGWKTVWTSGDKTKISNGASNTGVFEIPNASAIKSNGQEATFTLCDDETFTNGDGAFYAAYPADGVTLSGSSISGTIPTLQDLSAATEVNPAYQYMTAYTTDGNLSFKNIVSFFKINVTSSTAFPINVIKVVANDGTYLSGNFTATISTTGAPTSISVSGDNAKTFVELQSDVAMNGTYYLAVVAPITSKTLKMTLLLESNTVKSGSNVIEQKIYQRINTGLTFGYKNVYDLGTYDANNTKMQAKILSNVIDLGLPSGTIWATRNIAGTYNADSLFTKEIGDFGQYYAWAEDFGYGESWEINPNHTGTTREASFSVGSDSWPQDNKTHYKWSTYKWCDGTGPNSGVFGQNTGGNICKYKSGGLDIYDDVAYIKSAGSYCMPTSTQQIELMNEAYCTRNVAENGTPAKYNGKPGVKFTSVVYTNRSLWLPAAGSAYIDVGSGQLWSVGTKGRYWSRTLYSVNNGYCLDWPVMKNGNSSTKISYDERFCGRSIRAVVTNEAIAELNKP